MAVFALASILCCFVKNNVIAISRQYGSGGRELANILAEKLGYKLYDR